MLALCLLDLILIISNNFVHKFKDISLLEKEQKALAFSARLPNSCIRLDNKTSWVPGGHTNTGVGGDNHPKMEIGSSHSCAEFVTQFNSHYPASWVCSGQHTDAGECNKTSTGREPGKAATSDH